MPDELENAETQPGAETQPETGSQEVQSGPVSTPLKVAQAVADYIAALNLFTVAPVVSLAPNFDIVDETGLKLFVKPVSTTITQETREIVKESVGVEVSLVQYTGIDETTADNALKLLTELQLQLALADIETDESTFNVEKVTVYGSTFVGGGAQVDGLYESDDLESAYIIKSPLVIVLARRVGIYPNGTP